MHPGRTPLDVFSAAARLFSHAAVLCAAALCLALNTSSPAQAAAAVTLATCSWDRPGANPYRGELGAAVDRYTDIPAATRTKLKERMATQRYDDLAVIGRNHITGGSRYSPELRDMHFGNGRVCRTVTRQGWPAQAEERGLVYCEGAHCIIVPTVCRNVSRVTRLAPANRASAADSSSDASHSARALQVVPEDTELQFDAPGAGRALSAAGDAMEWLGPQAMTLVGSDALGGVPAALGASGPADSNGAAAPAVVSLAGVEPLNGGGDGSSNSPGSFNSGAAFFAPNPGGGANTGFTPVPRPLAPLENPFGSGGFTVPDSSLDLPTAAVPEPGTALLMLLGVAGVVRWAGRRVSRAA